MINLIVLAIISKEKLVFLTIAAGWTAKLIVDAVNMGIEIIWIKVMGEVMIEVGSIYLVWVSFMYWKSMRE
jgi:hypothetical protein